ncbi:exosome component 5 [Catenaria anguillulae PL171]|uniref:Exosome component 5 n=1 Tax=Catenaria anguillulae PL171 TaxID=765915 RepID=A0A1Y2HL51_9FUNG|nr:exosome component 5 [Catenaria anguillulae PL171]
MSNPSKAFARADRRPAGQLRPLHSTHGFLHRADGSAQFTVDKTSVICGIHGPVEVKLRDEKLDRATLEVVFKQHISLPTTREKFLETTIQSTLEPLIKTALHPRTLIQLSFQTIQNDGSLLAAAYNAACVALIDAGIPLQSAFAAACIAILPDGTVLMDPTADEEEQAASVHTFVFDSATMGESGAYMVHSNGQFTVEQFEKCYQYAKAAAKHVIEFLKVVHMPSGSRAEAEAEDVVMGE